MANYDPREEIIGHMKAMRAFALSLTQNQALADDIVQDAVIKAWTNFEKFEDGTNLRAWLFTILRNCFYSHRRKLRNEVEDVDGLIASALATKPAHDGRLQLQDLFAALLRVPSEQREALLLVGAAGFSYDEAAELCGVPLGTIKSRANRARQHLADKLGLTNGDPVELTDKPTQAVLSRIGVHAF